MHGVMSVQEQHRYGMWRRPAVQEAKYKGQTVSVA